jgi:glycosyltransferase involved in cell wall biosynthesis
MSRLTKIIVIHKNSIDVEPPTQTLVLTLNDLGYQVKLITLSCNDHWHNLLLQRGVEITIVKTSSKIYNLKLVGKLFLWFKYSFVLRKIIKYNRPNSLFWFINPNSIAPFHIFNLYKNSIFINHYLEMYENSRFYKWIISKSIKKSFKVVLPEENRSAIFQSIYNLNTLPSVLPNKPYIIFDKKIGLQYVKNNCFELYDAISKGKKIILYQGNLSNDRNLIPFIKAFSFLEEYVFVIMGKDYGQLKKYINVSSRIIYVKEKYSPEHLYVTSVAHIGILMYNPTSLNQIFCAPNKIFEYGGYGIPMIGNRIPGLVGPFRNFTAGEVCDINSVSSIQDSLHKIDKDYNLYSNGAKKLSDSININDIVNNILN